MAREYLSSVAIAMAGIALCQGALAQCEIGEETKQLDPVEVGFCESDAVFVGKVDARLETIRAYTPEGETTTKHFRVESSTVRVVDAYKGKLPDKVTMTADLYDQKSGAFSFQNGTEYLVFAKRKADGEYAGASAACSVQPTVPLADAASIREQLELHRKGAKKIDCKSIRKRS